MHPASSSQAAETAYEPEDAEVGAEAVPAPDPQRRTGLLRKVVVLLLIICASGLAAWKIHDNLANAPVKGRQARSDAERGVPVLAAPVLQKPMPLYLTAPGTVTAYYSVTMHSRVDGQLLSVEVREGQAARKGQLLAQIDPAPYQAALAQAEGQLAKDRAAAAYADAAAERYKSLFAAGIISKDQEQTEVSAAGQVQGALAADQAAVQAAKVNLAFTRIVSPIDGVVGLRQIDPGNIVHGTDATGLFLITQLDPIAVIFSVPEDELPKVKQAQREEKNLIVEAYDRSDTTLLGKGKLLTLDNAIDTTTGTDKVKAVFNNKDDSLFPNQFVHVRLILKQVRDALVIPAAAVQMGSAGAFVYAIRQGVPTKRSQTDTDENRDGHAVAKSAPMTPEQAHGGKGTAPSDKYYVEARPITIDAREGSEVIVGAGLAPGDQVVIDGMEKLKEHSVVAVLRKGPGSKVRGHVDAGSSETDRGQLQDSLDKDGQEHKQRHQGSAP